MSYFKPISISLSPNVQKDDVNLALHFLIRPWLWKYGKGNNALQLSLQNYLGLSKVILFNSGRSSFFALLKALELPPGSEVIVQAFTCNAVPNPIIWAGLTPIYVDCNIDDYNMSVHDLEEKISPRTRVIVAQHTFGKPADMNTIEAICRKYNIILLEDCAHALGGEYQGRRLGSFGKASFFSFSRDKVISSVYGGAVATNDLVLAEKIKKEQEVFGMPSFFWIKQQLLHPILLRFIILPLYSFLDLGKIILVASQWLHILSKAVHWKEKVGLRPDYFPKALPNALSALALHQLSKIEKFQAHRKKLFTYYAEQLKNTDFTLPIDSSEKQSYLRFTIQHQKAHEILYSAWHEHNMLLGDWYTTPVAPFDTQLGAIKYKNGSCKNAEILSKKTINLPTHINISQKDAERIVTFLKKYT